MPNFDEYFPFDSGYGAPATSARWRKMARLFMPDGIVRAGPEHLTDMTATIQGGNITVSPGAVVVHGYYAELHTAQTFAVGPTGMVVAGADLTNEIVSLYYKNGVTDYSGLTQTDVLWEIPLWLISSGAITATPSAAINPGRGLWTGFGSLGSWYTVNAGATTVFNLGSFRVTHPCDCVLVAGFQIQNTNSIWAQIAYGNIIVQSGLPDEQSSWAMELFYWPGGGGLNANYPFCVTTALKWGFAFSTPGLKTGGLKISAGGGPPVQIANMTIDVLQVGTIANQ